MKRRPKLEALAQIINSHMQKGTRPGNVANGLATQWRPGDLAAETGKDERTVRNWMNACSRPPSLAPLEKAFFGKNLSLHYADVVALRQAYAAGGRKGEKVDVFAGLVAPPPHKLQPRSDAPGQLSAHELDHLPINPMVTILAVSYGEGPRVIDIPGDALSRLAPDQKQLLDNGDYGGPSRYVPNSSKDPGTVASTESLYLPRKFRVSIDCAEANYGVQLYTCTDMPYGAQPVFPKHWPLTINGVLGVGGIAAFLDRRGKPYPRNEIGLGGELGCAALLTVVAFREREPMFRTPYFVVVRKGIRYPDDRWRSTITGGPVLSPSDSIESARFVFQSWETKGLNKDLFVADFNGQRMCNLNAADETALETFDDDDGCEVIRWIDKEHIQFCTYANGNGFGEIAVRRDCAASD